jgi:TorA maturation chaperone TorD
LTAVPPSLALLADLAQLLAEAFLEPEAELRGDLEALLEGDPGPSLAEPLRIMAENALPPQDQAVEYARLFLHARDTYTVDLFESVQARGHQMAPEVLGPLQAIYDEADLSVRSDLAIPPDHLGLELACLSILLGQIIEGDPEDRAHLAELTCRLLREHLRPFLEAVAEQLPQVGAQPYYLCAASGARALLVEAERVLSDPVPREV